LLNSDVASPSFYNINEEEPKPIFISISMQKVDNSRSQEENPKHNLGYPAGVVQRDFIERDLVASVRL
jgi:hypothetical protein